MFDFLFPPKKRGGTGFHAGTLIHTPNGLRPVSDLKEGDLVLTPGVSGNEREERKVSRIARVKNAPMVTVSVSFNNKSESLYFAGLPGLLVSGIDPEVANDPDYPESWLSHLKSKIGWQEICGVEYGLRVHSIADPLAGLWRFKQVWRSNDSSVGWTELSRDSDLGYRIEFHGDGEIVEHADTDWIWKMVEGVLAEDEHLDRHDSEKVAEDLALRQAVFSLELQDGSPFFVGRNGLLIQPATRPHAFEVWANQRYFED